MANIAKHKKRCKECVNLPQQLTAGDLRRLLDAQVQKNKDLEHRIVIYEQQTMIKDEAISMKDKEIGRLMSLITNNNTTNNDHSTNNGTINHITNVNHYYVLDGDGVRNGLDLSKLRTFGTENVDYIDKTKPLPTILKDIYCNEAHPENKVLSHEFLNLQWIMFRYQDHILRLHLEMDRSEFVVFRKLVCDNVERLLGQKYENYDETYHATRELLQTMDNDVRALIKDMGREKAVKKMPIWNPEQLTGVEERIWKSYMRDPSYSQNRLALN